MFPFNLSHFKPWLSKPAAVFVALLLVACTGVPDKVTPVNSFKLEPYLGTWYEIARLDHSFERNLSNVTANYTLNADGSVKVINRGWNTVENRWSEAEGKAKFVEQDNVGYLKVSFFGPFYGSYIVYYLEPDYSVSLVSGPNHDYFWILSRTPNISEQQLSRYISIANGAGFNTDALIFPAQDRATTN
ncbi:lipocalin family protein [Vibrio hippocampi]